MSRNKEAATAREIAVRADDLTTGQTPDLTAAVQIAAKALGYQFDPQIDGRDVVAALHAAGRLTDPAEVARLRELLDARTADHDAVVAERDALAEQVAALQVVADAARGVIADQALPDSSTMCELASALDALPPAAQRR